MKAHADFQQASHGAIQDRASRRRPQNARQDFQQRRFARAIVADDTDGMSGGDLETEFVERKKRFARLSAGKALAQFVREDGRPHTRSAIKSSKCRNKITAAVANTIAEQNDIRNNIESSGAP